MRVTGTCCDEEHLAFFRGHIQSMQRIVMAMERQWHNGGLHGLNTLCDLRCRIDYLWLFVSLNGVSLSLDHHRALAHVAHALRKWIVLLANDTEWSPRGTLPLSSCTRT